MKEAILEAQSAEVDGVSGATITSDAVKSAVQKCLDQAMGKEPAEVGGYTAGTYTAEAKGRNGAIVVSVTFSEDSIESVEVTEPVSYTHLDVYKRQDQDHRHHRC